MKTRRLMVWLLLLTGAVAIAWTMRAPLLRAALQWLDVGETPRRADYVMILTGDEDTRPFTAAALVKAGFANRVLVTQSASNPQVDDRVALPAYEMNRQVLLKRGIASDDITILPGAAAATYDEANALAAFLKDRPKTRVLVVTSDYHTRRSRWVFARTLGDRADQVSFISAPTDEFRKDCWWQDEESFVAVTTEYLKLAFYLVAYGHLGYWLAACGGLVLVAQWVHRRELVRR